MAIIRLNLHIMVKAMRGIMVEQAQVYKQAFTLITDSMATVFMLLIKIAVEYKPIVLGII